MFAPENGNKLDKGELHKNNEELALFAIYCGVKVAANKEVAKFLLTVKLLLFSHEQVRSFTISR